jgi:two-component system CheB/CheR fusion protein
MIADELRAYQGSGAEAPVIEGTSVRLRAKPAESFALAVHELATNAVKYGALSAPTGRLRVAWSIGTSGTEKLFEFRWAESGLEGLPPPPRRRGFGTEVLERSLAYELGADTRLSFRPDGLDCRISVPVERLLMP